MGRKDRIEKMIRVVLLIDVVIIAIYLYIYGFSISNFIKNTGSIITISMLIIYVINKWLWKIRFLNFLLDSPPNLNGEWQGTIINTKDGKEQKMKMTIKQTYLDIYIKVIVERGNSLTWTGEVIKINNNDWKLIWNWHSNNKAGEFSGTTIVNVLNEEKLDGFYYTNSNIDGRGCTAGIFKAHKKENKIKK